MTTNNQTNFVATAFLSCSLRPEDKSFVEYIERILIAHQIKPFGTVGLYSAAPTNTVAHMKKNILLADFVVIVATPRYLQKNIKTGKVSYGLPEMVHVETGMAYMAEKPVVVFVQEGTDVGNFLPNVTQYIILNGKQEDLNTKWGLINSLLRNAYNIVRQIKDQAANKSFWIALTTGLAIYGSIKLAQVLITEDKSNDETKNKITYDERNKSSR
jgi:hypothetical protein